uniref:Reverse transcriptase domain-containing protein n=1 Tax=Chelydra serpentina TaxID=8475 RepID=A0A8C3S2K1_CHESE
MRKITYFIRQAQRSDVPSISLDVEKAFDRVKWPSLIAALKKIRFEPIFLNWVSVLYNSPLLHYQLIELFLQPFN